MCNVLWQQNDYFYTNLRTKVGNIDCEQHPYAQAEMRCIQCTMYNVHSQRISFCVHNERGSIQ